VPSSAKGLGKRAWAGSQKPVTTGDRGPKISLEIAGEKVNPDNTGDNKRTAPNGMGPDGPRFGRNPEDVGNLQLARGNR